MFTVNQIIDKLTPLANSGDEAARQHIRTLTHFKIKNTYSGLAIVKNYKSFLNILENEETEPTRE